MSLPTLPPPKDLEPFSQEEIDARAIAYLAESKKRTAQDAYEAYCPGQYRHYDLENPTAKANRAAHENVMQWRFGAKGLLLSGPTGQTKTRTTWELIRVLAGQGVEVRPYHAMDWFSSLHENVKFGRDEAKEWVDAVAWRPIVFIDDYGQEANLRSREDWAQSWFFRFIDLRIERGLPLIITTNLSAKDIANKNESIKSDPLLRRLLEICEVVRFGPPSA